jgi:oligo-1,6-glucosidase
MYKEAAFAAHRRVEGIGMLSNIIENHDEPRGVSHYLPEGQVSERSKKLLGGLNFMMKGLPFLYQGQEIGMENCHYTSIDEADDISALDQYRVALDAGLSQADALAAVDHHSRDNARTPFQWDSTANAGFTTGAPWLPVNPNYKEINLAEQKDRPDSVWNFYRQLIQLRRNPEYAETVIYGEMVPYLAEQKNLMAYYRRGKDKTLLVLGNWQAEPQKVALPGTVKEVLLNNCEDFALEGECVTLEDWQFVVVEL